MNSAIIIAITTLILIHLYFGISIYKFFDIAKRKWTFGLTVIFLFLTICFPISLTLVHFQENIFTRNFYYISGLWIGLLVNAIILTIPVHLINLFIKPNKKILKKITIFFLSLAAIYTVYGAWNALTPNIKEITVPIKNLPANWENKTIIQLSDVHLGYIYRPAFLDEVAAKVNSLNPDLIVITGDLFDGMGVDPNQFVDGLNKLSAKQGVYFITGNHESYAGLDKILNILKKTNLTILNDQIVDLNGLQLIGLSYPVSGERKDIAKIIQPGLNFDRNKPSILLYHTPKNIAADNNSRSSAYLNPDTEFSYAKDLGINLQLSGHSHSGQFFPFTILTHFIYNGYEYGLHTDGDFSIYTTSGTGSWGPPIRTMTDSEIVKITLTKK